MVLYLFPLLRSFKLEIRFINIQPDTLTFTDLILVEKLNIKKFSIFSQDPRRLNVFKTYSSDWSNHFWGPERIQDKNLKFPAF